MAAKQASTTKSKTTAYPTRTRRLPQAHWSRRPMYSAEDYLAPFASLFGRVSNSSASPSSSAFSSSTSSTTSSSAVSATNVRSESAVLETERVLLETESLLICLEFAPIVPWLGEYLATLPMKPIMRIVALRILRDYLPQLPQDQQAAARTEVFNACLRYLLAPSRSSAQASIGSSSAGLVLFVSFAEKGVCPTSDE
jgi:hypothetical protein